MLYEDYGQVAGTQRLSPQSWSARARQGKARHAEKQQGNAFCRWGSVPKGVRALPVVDRRLGGNNEGLGQRGRRGARRERIVAAKKKGGGKLGQCGHCRRGGRVKGGWFTQGAVLAQRTQGLTEGTVIGDTIMVAEGADGDGQGLFDEGAGGMPLKQAGAMGMRINGKMDRLEYGRQPQQHRRQQAERISPAESLPDTTASSLHGLKSNANPRERQYQTLKSYAYLILLLNLKKLLTS